MQVGCSREVVQEECCWKVLQEGCSKVGMLGSQDTEGFSGVGMQEGAGSKDCLRVRIEVAFSGTGMLQGRDTQGKGGGAWKGYQRDALGLECSIGLGGRYAGEMAGVRTTQKAEMQEGCSGEGCL